MGTALKQEHIFTVAYIETLPDGERAELIDGVVYDMAPPNTRHQAISGELYGEIRSYIKSKKGKCKVFAAPFAVYLNNDDLNYVEPDISVICDPEKLDEKGCNGAPDFIIEILSPSNKKWDYLIKQKIYQEAGVREYWIVDPAEETVNVFLLSDGQYSGRPYGDDAVIPVATLPGCAINLPEIFGE
jgi:Uma2 family endonuclease